MTEPTTEAGRRLLAYDLHDYDDQPTDISAEVLAIETEAAAAALAALRVEVEGLREALRNLPHRPHFGPGGHNGIERCVWRADVLETIDAALSQQDDRSGLAALRAEVAARVHWSDSRDRDWVIQCIDRHIGEASE